KEKVITDSDEVSYHTIATNVINYHTFSTLKDTLDAAHLPPTVNKPHLLCLYHDSLRLPGYPFFVAIIYYIVGIKPYIAILVQILVSLLIVVLIYRTCMLLSNHAGV